MFLPVRQLDRVPMCAPTGASSAGSAMVQDALIMLQRQVNRPPDGGAWASAFPGGTLGGPGRSVARHAPSTPCYECRYSCKIPSAKTKRLIDGDGVLPIVVLGRGFRRGQV